MSNSLLLCFLVLCAASLDVSDEDISAQDKERDLRGLSETFLEDPTIEVNGHAQPTGDWASFLEHNEKSKLDDQAAVEKYVINGEEYDRKDVEFDSVKDPTVVVTDGVKEEADEPEEDQAYYGWTKHPYSWCTVDGRELISRDLDNPIDYTVCQKLCQERVGCSAIEFWEAYNYACYVCKDISKITSYPNEDDLAYPVHVWVQNQSPTIELESSSEGSSGEVPFEGPSESASEGSSEGLSEGPSVVPSEGSKEGPTEGPTKGPSEAFNPCDPGSHGLLNTYDRLVGNRDQSSVQCDQRYLFLPGWFRFAGAAGDRIPTKCPKIKRCGTHATGWLNGSHPSVVDGIVSRKVCYHWTDNCCHWKNDIQVKNCGAFYVYELQKPPVCSLRYCGEPKECSDGGHQDLNQADRAMGYSDQSGIKCDGRAPDNILVPKWYRITGDSGDQIPERCVPMRRCGTDAPGWLNGQHPSLQEGVVKRQVCYHWTGGCCQWKNYIKIRNCGDFYVYELQKPPACPLRYCGNMQAPTTQPPPTITTPKPVFDPCDARSHKFLHTYDRLVGNKEQSSVKCDQRDPTLPGWFRFTGAAGDRMPTKCPETKRCGTHAPGWLNGNHPSVAEGIVSREVCYHWGNCCRWKNKINVKNCGAFYVYELQKPPACSLRYCGEPKQCSDGGYQDLNQADRAMGNSDQSTVKCDGRAPDNMLLPKWYRMTGDSGDQIPESCVPKRSCGTHAPGWLNGTHPSVQEGIVVRQVCYHWSSGCCQWSNNVKIQNCGDFFVYELQKPPACSLRYCGNKEANTTIPPDATPRAPQTPADGCKSYKVLSEADRAQGNEVQNNRKCDQRDLVPGWYRFQGFAGERMADRCVPFRRCGTHAAGWLNGPHPTVADGVVTREVCFHWSNQCCRWKSTVKVRNCSYFFVYKLTRTPACSLRYCGNASAVPTTAVPLPTSAVMPLSDPEVIVKCGQNEMSISIPKTFLHGLDVEHIRLSDKNCGATENPARDRYILRTKLTECQTKSRHTKNFVSYTNKVEEIPVENEQIIRRIREVEIPFSCYFSNTGVVSAVGLEVTSKKIVFSEKGFGEFALEMKIFPDDKFLGSYQKKEFPVTLPLRKKLFVEVRVDTKDARLGILAETCFATPDPDPNKPGLKFVFIENGCSDDETLDFIPPSNERYERFSLEAFKFLGDHQFVYMHCKVKICSANDPNSRCAQGCLRNSKQRRSLYTQETNDEEYLLAQGPFIRKVDTEDIQLEETEKEWRGFDGKGQGKFATATLVAVAAACLMGISYFMHQRRKKSRSQVYHPKAIPVS
ncbi:uncharacterized protein LOC111336033 [Stylophora pistillata]|uniref:uncharacterized protein LOC111336033 n=1 Tax=Stylophora pistillata TaxID=50429 RepID=UPI000C04AAF8|nr:uncharacterized protein LOC111336033 [Stylophora pistillata]